MFHHHHWARVLTRTSLRGMLLGCVLVSSPQTASTTEPMPAPMPAILEVALLSPHATSAQGLTRATWSERSPRDLALPLPKTIKVSSNQAGDTPKGGGLKGFVERLLDRIKKDKGSPPGTSEPPPTSGSLPGSLTFTGTEGGPNPAAQTLSITNTGGGTLNWTADDTAAWLSLSPASGTTTTEADVITVSVSTAGLTANTYSTTITLTALGSTNPTQQVPVTLTVTPPSPTIGKSPTILTFIAQEGGAQLTAQTLNITNTGKGTLSWSVSESASWLSLSPASGTTTTESDAISVSVNTAGLLTNTYTAPITITADGASNTPQQVLVTLAITAPASTKATLTWNGNTESDLAGYKVYTGTSSGAYGPPVDVGKVTTFDVINLQSGKTYYFAVTAYDKSGNESGNSNEANKSIN